MKESCTAQELSKILHISDRAIRKKAQQGKLACKEMPNPKGGGVVRIYSVADLPEEWRIKISEYWLQSKLAGGGAGMLPVPSARIAVRGEAGSGLPGEAEKPMPLSCDVNPANIPDRLQPAPGPCAAIPEKSKKIGLAKHRLVTAWREVLDPQPWSRRGEATDAFLLAYRSGRLLPEVRELLGDVSKQTLYRIDKQLRDANGDYHAVADGRGGWRKHGSNIWRPRSLSNAAKEELLSCWLLPEQPTVSHAIRGARINLAAKGLQEPAEEATWRRWLREYEKRNRHVVVLAREGEKAYRDKVGPYITRDSGILVPGQVLVADGHDLNFEIIHPATGKPARMKLVMFFDWASRMPVGWQIMPTESTAAISAALFRAIINLGKLPQIVYLDNGRAFKSKFFTETKPDLRELAGLYWRLAIAIIFAMPYNARAKVIERFFFTMNEQLERMMPSYCGSSIGGKPAWRARNEKFHRIRHERRTGGWVPDIREASYILSLYIEWYGRQPHDGLGGKLPAEVLDAGRGPGVEEAELRFEFLWSKKVTARRCRVTLYGIEYESDCLHGWGDGLIAKYDTSDLSRIWLYTLEGAYLGEALPVQALNPIAKMLGDQVGVDRVKHEMERQRRLARETKKNLIELGAGPENAQSIDALPWNRKAPVLLTEEGGRRAEPAENALSDGERARLELVVSRAAEEIEARGEAALQVERPEFFASEHARYEWCWRAIHEHKAEISHEDAAFMGYFEETAEYGENYVGRYRALAKLYGG